MFQFIIQRYMVRIHGFLQNFTGRIQMDSCTWSQISGPAQSSITLDGDWTFLGPHAKLKTKTSVFIMCWTLTLLIKNIDLQAYSHSQEGQVQQATMMPDQVQYYFQLAQNQAQQQQTTTQSSNTAVAAAATATTGVTTAQPGQQILVQTPGGGQVCEHQGYIFFKMP